MTTDRTATDRVLDAWIDESIAPEDLAVAAAAGTSDAVLISVLAERPRSDPQMTPLEAEQVLQRVASGLIRERRNRRYRIWAASVAAIAVFLLAVATWPPKTQVRPVTRPVPHEAALVKEVQFECIGGQRRVYFRMQVYETKEVSRVHSKAPS